MSAVSWGKMLTASGQSTTGQSCAAYRAPCIFFMYPELTITFTVTAYCLCCEEPAMGSCYLLGSTKPAIVELSSPERLYERK
ncbi:hypothetical protein WAI453_009659 [Rhynchosporium graminicola]